MGIFAACQPAKLGNSSILSCCSNVAATFGRALNRVQNAETLAFATNVETSYFSMHMRDKLT